MSVQNAGAEEIRSRIRRLQNTMGGKGADLIVILQNVDLFYFSGTIQKGYLFVPAEGEALLFVQKDYERAVHETPLTCIRLGSLQPLLRALQGGGSPGINRLSSITGVGIMDM